METNVQEDTTSKNIDELVVGFTLGDSLMQLTLLTDTFPTTSENEREICARGRKYSKECLDAVKALQAAYIGLRQAGAEIDALKGRN